MDGNISKGLYIGLEINNDNMQIAVYNKKSNEAESVAFADGTYIYNNSTNIDSIKAEIKDGIPADINSIAADIKMCIDTIITYTGNQLIERITICVEPFDKETLDLIDLAMNNIGIRESKIRYISKIESFCYYSLNMKKELWNNGVCLMDFDKGRITAHMLNVVKSGKDLLAVVATNEYEDGILAKILDYSISIKDETADRALTHIASELLAKKTIASVYLTGPGFDTNDLPAGFVKVICNRRRVFAGQNLYVKGACFSAREDNENRIGDIIPACKNRITTGIETDIVVHGELKRFRIVRIGTNWYKAARSVDFIMDDIKDFKLLMCPCDDRDVYEENISLNGIPYRTGKTTRIRVNITFNSDDRFSVSIRDMGFGDFVKSSGKVVTKDVEF